jgi:hypothetical protein
MRVAGTYTLRKHSTILLYPAKSWNFEGFMKELTESVGLTVIEGGKTQLERWRIRANALRKLWTAFIPRM